MVKVLLYDTVPELFENNIELEKLLFSLIPVVTKK